MIDLSKLKYYKALCEMGVLSDREYESIDSLISAVEEQQFEQLKRLETTTDEKRKNELNAKLVVIEMQLKELSAIKTTLDSGIIATENSDTSVEVAEKSNQVSSNEIATDIKADSPQKQSGGKNKIIIVAIVALICVVAISAFLILNKLDNVQMTSSSENSETINDSTANEDENQTELGVGGFDNGVSAQKQYEDQGETETILTEGYYVLDIRNKSLIDGGLELGDKLVSLNGETVITSSDLHNIINRYNPGDEAILVVSRNQKELTIKGLFIETKDLLAPRTGKGSVKINGRSFEFDYDNADLVLLD